MTEAAIGTLNIKHAMPAAKCREDIATAISTGLDVLALQEMGGVDRKPLPSSFDGWDAYVPDAKKWQASSPIMWRSARFEKQDSGSKLVSASRNVGNEGAGPSDTEDKYVNWVQLKDKVTKQVIVVINSHFVASVEVDGAPTNNPAAQDRITMYREHMAGLQELIRVKKLVGAVVVTGDFNVDYRKDSQHKAKIFPYTGLGEVNVWASYRWLGMPSGGTHEGGGSSGTHSGENGRLIDYVCVERGDKVAPTSHAIHRGLNSDHNLFVAMVELKAEKTITKRSLVTFNLESGQSNAQVKEDLAWVVDNFKPDLWTIQEGETYLNLLRTLQDYGVAVADGQRKQPILFRKSLYRLVGTGGYVRGVSWAHLKDRSTGDSVYVVNLHVDADPETTKLRLQHFANTVKDYGEGENIVLWAGDFDVAKSTTLKKDGLISVYEELNIVTVNTPGALGSYMKDGRVKAEGFTRSPKLHSNYRALKATFSFDHQVGGSPKDPTAPPEPNEQGTPTDPNAEPNPPKPPTLSVQKDQGPLIDHTDCCNGEAL